MNTCSWVLYAKDYVEHLGVCPGKLYTVPDLLYFIMEEDTHKQLSLKEDCDKYKISEANKVPYCYGKKSHAPSGLPG